MADDGGRTGEAMKDAETGVRARNEALILAAARDVFSRKGFDGARMAEIATLSGLPKANVYYYFATKEQIYRAIIGSLLSEWNRAFDHIADGRDPADAIRDYVRAKLDYSRRHAAESKLFANEAVRGARFLSRKDRARIQAITREKAAVVEGWIRAGKMAPVDPRHLFVMLWSATQFYADFDTMACDALEVKRLRGADFEAAAATIADVVLRGCGIVEGPAR
jgi:TetR/AcrR family transcriptional regulator